MNNEDWEAWQLLENCTLYLEHHTVKDMFGVMEEAIYVRAHELYENVGPTFKKKKKAYDIKEIVDYCLTHVLPKDCDRRNKLMKNVAIYLYNKGYTSSEINDMDAILSNNCPGRKRGELKSWVPWAKQKSRKVNIKELEDVARQMCSR